MSRRQRSPWRPCGGYKSETESKKGDFQCFQGYRREIYGRLLGADWAGSIRFRRRRNSGRIGAGTSSSTAIRTRRKSVHEDLLDLVQGKDIRYHDECRPLLPTLTKAPFYTHWGDYGLFNASEPCCQGDIRQRRRPSARWSKHKLHRSGRRSDAADRRSTDSGAVRAPARCRAAADRW